MSSINLNGAIKGNLEAENTRSARRNENSREAESNSTATSNASAKSDALSFSERAAKAAELADRVRQAPDVRSERVEQLSRLISRGAYEPSGRDIADAIIRTEQ